MPAGTSLDQSKEDEPGPTTQSNLESLFCSKVALAQEFDHDPWRVKDIDWRLLPDLDYFRQFPSDARVRARPRSFACQK
jgi:hypothetical protein